MTSLEDKAAQARDIYRAEDATGAYRIVSLDLVEASEIGGEDSFPKFGEFADVVELTETGEDRGEAWLECPADLAQGLLDIGVEAGSEFVIESVKKDDDGQWRFSVASPQDAAAFMADGQ